MDRNHFAALARTLAPSRRTAVATLLVAGSGLVGRPSGEAKHKGPDCGQRAQQRCRRDIETCRTVYLANCGGEPGECEAQADCCDACSAHGVLACLVELQRARTVAGLVDADRRS